jgi:AAA ATPase domain
MTSGRLRDHARRVDGAAFVGREAELAAFDALLANGSVKRILLVSGPGGIGKSALLREMARRAVASGATPIVHDARELPVAVDQLAKALTPPASTRRPIVLIDESEALGANLLSVRDSLLDLPADVRVVIAGRGHPDSSWRHGELLAVTREMTLAPLSDADADQLLLAGGMAEPVQREAVLKWAEGSPLALVVATSTRDARTAATPEVQLEERLTRLLGGTELEGVDPEVLEVAALTRAVDARLLAAALPGRSTRDALASLQALSVVERSGSRAILHPVLSRAISARLRAGDRARFDILIRRIADHLAARARLGDPQALFEMTDLLEDPSIRTGAGLGASTTHYADTVRPGDVAAIIRTSGVGDDPVAARLPQWTAALPEFATTTRASDGTLTGLAMFAPMNRVAGAGIDDPEIDDLLGRLVTTGADASRTLIGIAALFVDVDVDVDGATLAETLRVGNTAAMARSGVLDLRWIMVRYPRDPPVGVAFLASMGYRRMDVPQPGDASQTWLVDFGPGGLIGYIHSAVLVEHGFTAAPTSDVSAVLRDAAHDPDAREALQNALTSTFGESSDERRLAHVIELTHLSPGVGERDILEDLHVSRATYYRLLRVARERLANRAE